MLWPVYVLDMASVPTENFKGPEELFDFCLRKRILIRDCSNYPGLKKGYYRVAVKRHEENIRLIEVLEGGILWQKQ